MFDGAGAWIGARGVCRDVTEAREREAALARARNREQLFSFILREINENTDPEKMLSAAARSIAMGLDAGACRIDRYHTGARIAEPVRYGDGFDGIDIDAILDALARMPEHQVGLFADGAVLAIATRHGGRMNGAICLGRHRARAPEWRAGDRELLSQIGHQFGVVLAELADQELLRKLSRTDPLTGLLNRRVFYQELEQRLVRARRTGRSGALCYIDLDNFKGVNDSHGHQLGDEVLRLVAALLAATARSNDLLARLGGDEFALWLDETGDAGTRIKARALARLGASLAPYAGATDRPLGASIGIAVHDPANGEDLEALMARADRAMYDVKRNGKGCCEIAPATTETARKKGAA